jgi:hypothetical protein
MTSQSPHEHYLEAERLLELADSNVSANWEFQTGESKADVLRAAQVHATLATVRMPALTIGPEWVNHWDKAAPAFDRACIGGYIDEAHRLRCRAPHETPAPATADEEPAAPVRYCAGCNYATGFGHAYGCRYAPAP